MWLYIWIHNPLNKRTSPRPNQSESLDPASHAPLDWRPEVWRVAQEPQDLVVCLNLLYALCCFAFVSVNFQKVSLVFANAPLASLAVLAHSPHESRFSCSVSYVFYSEPYQNTAKSHSKFIAKSIKNPSKFRPKIEQKNNKKSSPSRSPNRLGIRTLIF